MTLLQFFSQLKTPNFSSILSEKVLRLFLGFFTTILVARTLNSNDLGSYALCLSVVAIATVLVNFGLRKNLLFDIATREDQGLHHFVYSAALIQFFVALPVLAFIFLSGENFVPRLSASSIFAITIAVLLRVTIPFEVPFEALSKQDKIAWFNIFGLFFLFLIRVVLIIHDPTLEVVLWTLVLEILILSLIRTLRFSSTFGFKYAQISLVTVLSYIKKGAPLLAATMTVEINKNIDRFFLNEFVSTESVGSYFIAQRMAEVLYIIPLAISIHFGPRWSKMLKNSRDKFYLEYLLINRIIWFICLAYIVMIFVFGETLFLVVFGQKFSHITSVAILLSLNALMNYLGMVGSYYLIALGLQKSVFYRGVTALGINIILNYLFVIYFGVLGVAIATTVSALIDNVLFDLFSAKTRRLVPLKFCFNIRWKCGRWG